MTREIKFRAWHKDNKEMWSAKDLIDNGYNLYADGRIEYHLFSYNNNTVFACDDFILMQFTGLHDKNGKEIWEGDVVTNGFRKGTVFVDGVEWGWGEYRLENKSIKSLEVLGNIYENSELLNGK